VLDPAAEQIQHAKKQRERIYDDDIYFVYSKPPENIPEWACDPEKIKDLPEAESHTENEYDVDDNYDNDIQLDNTDPNLDFLLNSAEMNLPRPEDLDKTGECSRSVS
jgi:hypothetical protein